LDANKDEHTNSYNKCDVYEDQYTDIYVDSKLYKHEDLYPNDNTDSHINLHPDLDPNKD
jgi:hypothetical protein